MATIWNTFGFRTDLDEKLVACLESFMRLYDQRKADLWRASECFVHAAAGVDEKLEGSQNKVIHVLFMMFGGTLGGTFGGITGGMCGTLGALCTTVHSKFCGDFDVVRAGVGFVGSLFGGVVGGAFTGAVGGSVNVAALVQGREDHGVFSQALCFAVGSAIGGMIGSSFSWQFGAAGGAVGGGFGAFFAMRATIRISRSLINYSFKKDPKAEMMKKTRGDLNQSIIPLMTELKTIRETCNKMASSDAVKGVADQTAKILAAVAGMERSVVNSQWAANSSEFLSCIKEASSQCRKIPEELQRMREEVEKVLVSQQERRRCEKL